MGCIPCCNVDEADLVSNLAWTPNFWLPISTTIALIRWVSNTWRFSHRPDVIWVSHFRKSQTTPTILHNQECYPPSYDTLEFCAPSGQSGRQHVVVRCRPICIVGILYSKTNLATIYLGCDHFRDMTQPILASNLVSIGMVNDPCRIY